jgi:hypothetical protein
MNRNRFVVGKYVIDFLSRPKKSPEELTEFFQKIMDDSKNMTCEEIRDYMKGNLVNKVNVMVDSLDMEIEAAIDYLETKIQDSPDQLKLEL